MISHTNKTNGHCDIQSFFYELDYYGEINPQIFLVVIYMLWKMLINAN